MIEVMSRSPEAWGPLSSERCSDTLFKKLVNAVPGQTKNKIKEHIKRVAKLKQYKVRFIQELISDEFIIEAEDEYAVRSEAANLFKHNGVNISFKTKPAGKWAGDYAGYDRITYVKVLK